MIEIIGYHTTQQRLAIAYLVRSKAPIYHIAIITHSIARSELLLKKCGIKGIVTKYNPWLGAA